MKPTLKHLFLLVAVVCVSGCATQDKASKPKVERGPQGTIAYAVQVEASEPGAKIEASGNYIGETPCVLKIFGDKDGTFHNFGQSEYVVRAFPLQPGQFEQHKVFHTGGWFTPEDRIPDRIYFEMSLGPATGGGTGASPAFVPVSPPVEPQPGGLRKVGSGTAFAITDDGYLLSNYHVVRDAERVIAAFSDERVEAKVVEKDLRNDLVLLKVFKATRPLPLGDSARVKLGEEVCSLGFPRPGTQGNRVKFDKGTIGSLTGMKDDVARFQISLPAQPGNSGGPLINSRGEVVGVVVSGLDPLRTLANDNSIPQNVNYAVKTSYARLLLQYVPDILGKLPTDAEHPVRPFHELAELATPSVVLVESYR